MLTGGRKVDADLGESVLIAVRQGDQLLLWEDDNGVSGILESNSVVVIVDGDEQ